MKRLWAPVVVLIVALVVLAFFIFQGTTQIYQINYPGGVLTKTVASGLSKTVSLSMSDSNSYVFFLLVPKTLAEDESQIGLSFDGHEDIWKNDPQILFYANSGKMNVTAEFSKNSSAASIAVIMPKEFVASLDKNQKSVLVDEFDKMLALDLNEDGANYLEKNLSVELTRTFASQGSLSPIENKNTAWLFAEVSSKVFASVQGAIEKSINAVKVYFPSSAEKPYDLNISLSSDTINFYQPEDIVLSFITPKDFSEYSIVFISDSGARWTSSGRVSSSAGGIERIPLEVASRINGSGISPGQNISFSIQKFSPQGETKPMKMLYNGKPTDSVQISVLGREALAKTEWPEKIEFGLTSALQAKSVDINVAFPKELLSNGELASKVQFVRVEYPKGTIYSDAPIPGLDISVSTGPEGKEPFVLHIQADYAKLISANPTLPQTIDQNIFLAYLFKKSAPEIELKINLNEPGAVLATSPLAEAANFVAEKKGWVPIIIDPFGKNETQIAQEAKSMIDSNYRSYSVAGNPLVYLLILGDQGNGMIPIQDGNLIEKTEMSTLAKDGGRDSYLPVLDNFYFGQLNPKYNESGKVVIDENSHVNLSVSRIPFYDSNEIINYFENELIVPKNDEKYVLFTEKPESDEEFDENNSVKQEWEKEGLIGALGITHSALSNSKKDKVASAIVRMGAENSADNNLNTVDAIAAGEQSGAFDSNSKVYSEANDVYATADLTELSISKSFGLSKYVPYFLRGDLTMLRPFSIGKGAKLLNVYVDIFNNFEELLSDSSIVEVTAHGSAGGYYGTETNSADTSDLGGSDANTIGKVAPINLPASDKIILSSSCEVSKWAGKQYLRAGSELFFGCYEVCNLHTLSLTNISNSESIGKSFKNLINSIPAFESPPDSFNQAGVMIMYGDPTMRYAAEDLSANFSETGFLVDTLSEYDLFKLKFSQDPQKCLTENKDTEKKMDENWRIQFGLADGNASSVSFKILQRDWFGIKSDKKISAGMVKTMALYHGNDKMTDLNFVKDSNSLIIIGEIDRNENIPLVAEFIVDFDSQLISFAPDSFDLEALVLPCFYNSRLTIFSKGNLSYAVNGGGKIVKIGGSYPRGFDNISDVYLKSGGKSINIKGNINALKNNYIGLVLDAASKKFLYENGALEDGYIIEFAS